MIRQYPVDFLRHSPIETTQPGFDVGDRELELGRRQRGGDGGIGIAENDHPRRALGHQDLLNLVQHGTRLAPMGSGADLEIAIRPGDIEFTKEDLGHLVIIMLTGMNDVFLNAGRPQGATHRPRLDELRACTDDSEDLHEE